MGSGGINPSLSPTPDLMVGRAAAPAPVVTAPPTPPAAPVRAPVSPPPVADRAAVVRGGDLAAVVPSTSEQVRTVLTAHAGRVPEAMKVVDGDLVLRFGADTIRASLVTLGGEIAVGGRMHDSVLGRSLQIFQAAHQANLPDVAIRSIMTAFSESAGTDSPAKAAQAMAAAFGQIAMASLVEAYVGAKDGLATDVRRVSSYSTDAFSAAETGSPLTAATNRNAGRSRVIAEQAKLDGGLHVFTRAFADARFNGDYSGAFDALQTFFQKTAAVGTTEHWRLRASNPAGAAPPLPTRPDTLRGPNLFDAAAMRPAASPKHPLGLNATPVASRSGWSRFTAAVKSPFVAIKHAVFGKPVAAGLVGVAAARNLVLVQGGVAAVGLLMDAAPATTARTDHEVTLKAVFGPTTKAVLKSAAQAGCVAELTALAAVIHAHPGLDVARLTAMVGTPPTKDSLQRLTSLLKVTLTASPGNPKAAVELLVVMRATKAVMDLPQTPETRQRMTAVLKVAVIASAGDTKAAIDLLAKVGASQPMADVVTLVAGATQALGRGVTLSALTTAATTVAAAKAPQTPEAVLLNVLNMAINGLVKDSATMGLLRPKISSPAAARQFVADMQALPAGAHATARLAYALLPAAQQPGMRALLSTLPNGRATGPQDSGYHYLLALGASGATGPVRDWLVHLAPHARNVFGETDGAVAFTKALTLATAMVASGAPLPSVAHMAQARRLNGDTPMTAEAAGLLLDSRTVAVAIPRGDYRPAPVASVALPATVTDIGGFEATSLRGDASISDTRFMRDPATGAHFMVKLATDDAPDMAASERAISVLGNQLGLPVNLVQVTSYDVAREKMGKEPIAEGMPGAADSGVQFRYATVHTPVGKAPVSIGQVWTTIGSTPEAADYRLQGRPRETGQGPSSWMRADAPQYMQALRDGVTTLITMGGRSVPESEAHTLDPDSASDMVVARHVHKIANPEVLDQVLAFDKLIGNADRHMGNLLMVPEEADGVTTYTVKLIDHGMAFLSGDQDGPEHMVEGRVAALTAYLTSLALPGNAEHAKNVVPMLTQFANLSDEQLTAEPFKGLPPDAMSSESRDRMVAILRAEQQVVRDFLAARPA
ncbi:MAG: hypothetical protein H7338_06985 [Candidatus Sericytochromatia bacterium]|nr:hypothetical protein [Candidatus Sericytochromatia bacterium]